MSAPFSIADLLPPAQILLLSECQNKKRAFEQATILMENVGGLSRSDLFQRFMQRERQGSTSVGYYGAIPHVHLDIKAPLCSLIRLKKPIQYDADNAPTSMVHTLFFIIAPENDNALHLHLLSLFSQLLADDTFMAPLAQIDETDAVYNHIVAWEKKNQGKLDELFSQQ